MLKFLHFIVSFLLLFPFAASATDVAPYFFTWAYKNNYYKTTSLMQARQQANLDSATLAFAITEGQCRFQEDLETMRPDIKKFMASGGRLIISFGGALGTYIESACKTDDLLFNAIDQLIQKTGITNLDFDIEGKQLSNKVIHDRRTRVLVRLQTKYPKMYLSYTLPVGISSGLNKYSLDIIRSSRDSGLRVNIVNLMTMDYYSTISGKTMGDLAIMSAEAVVRQLQLIYPQKKLATIYSMIGITPMIGTNDDHYIFHPADAKKVTNYAIGKKIGFLSYWGFQRDRKGGNDLNGYSLQNQYDFQYYDIFKLFKKQNALKSLEQ